MRRTTAASRTHEGDRAGSDASAGSALPEEMSGHVLGIIGAYRMGAVVEAQKLFPKRLPKTPREPAPRPAEGYIRNGVYHVAETAVSRHS